MEIGPLKSSQEMTVKTYLALLLLLFTSFALAEPALQSGLAPGDRAPAHNPNHITGPDAGTTTCPV